MFPCTVTQYLLSPNLLPQPIDGTFKDHIVDWIKKYIVSTYQTAQAMNILANIDRHCKIFSCHNILFDIYLQQDC